MLNLIDAEPFLPHWGQVYQGDELDAIVDRVPKPHAIASMVGILVGFGGTPNLSIYMNDTDTDWLPDETLLALVDGIIGLLKHGHNVLIHCVAGHYRSTYMDIAVHMGLGMPFDEALAMVQSRHPGAQLRDGTKAQLQRMEAQLQGELAGFE